MDSKSRAMTLNVIFGHGEGFEPTRWAVLDGGAKNPKAYMNSVHQTQHPTQFWYHNYPTLSVDNINLNHKIREGLWSTMNDQQAQDWLHLL